VGAVGTGTVVKGVRVLLVLVVGVLAAALGFVQFVAAVALRGNAVAGSWVRVVPEGVARRVERVDLSWPMPQVLVEVLARRALVEGDLERAGAAIARLGPSGDKLALQGHLDDARGDSAGADAAYLAADDLEDVEARVEILRRAHQDDRALALQNALIAHLGNDRTERDTLAQAYYLLGRLEEDEAYRFPIYTASRTQHQERAGDAYERALEISPLEERYLLGYANQLLNLERFAEARTEFLKARDADVTRPEPFAGLGETAFRLGDKTAALAYLARAQKIDAANDAVVRLAHELGT
jgi:tetratricopeptide (TPR) repeat protein